MSNNTFIYAENDLSVNSNAENGLEVGTYVYNQNQGKITFDIEYDDNDPNNDSGVGDVGTSVILSASLLNDSSKISLSGGESVFNKMAVTKNTPVVGVWQIKNGTEFSYLTLMTNNTFIYAENDLTVNSSAENGVEVGTYTYDSVNENITFNVVYDDNDPGNDSGVGDIGTPSVINAVLSNNNNTLTLPELVFTKVL